MLGWWGFLALGLLLSHMMDDVVQVVAVLELPCCRPGGGGWRGLCATGKCAVVGEEGVGEWRRASVGCPVGREPLEGWVGSKAGLGVWRGLFVAVCV